MGDSLPDGWESHIGEGSRPVTRESGYYNKWYYNEEDGFAIRVDTKGGFGAEVTHVVNLYRANFGKNNSIDDEPEHTRKFEADNQDDYESQLEAEEKAKEHAKEIMEKVNNGKLG